MRNHWIDERSLDEADSTPALGRDPDSSVAAQYEDSVPLGPEEADDPS